MTTKSTKIVDFTIIYNWIKYIGTSDTGGAFHGISEQGKPGSCTPDSWAVHEVNILYYNKKTVQMPLKWQENIK
mgnify:CR=1 FL=1